MAHQAGGRVKDFREKANRRIGAKAIAVISLDAPTKASRKASLDRLKKEKLAFRSTA